MPSKKAVTRASTRNGKKASSATTKKAPAPPVTTTRVTRARNKKQVDPPAVDDEKQPQATQAQAEEAEEAEAAAEEEVVAPPVKKLRATRARKKTTAASPAAARAPLAKDDQEEEATAAEAKAEEAKPKRTTRGRKRATPAANAQPQDDAANQSDSTKPPPSKKSKGKTTKAKAKADAATPPATATAAVESDRLSKIGAKGFEGHAQIAKDGMKIPLDDMADRFLFGFKVYIDPDGVIFDASLNQTNAGNNNNKFYRIQLLHNSSGMYRTWTRWGRVGDVGQYAVLGTGSLDSAMSSFHKKFKDKSGLSWENRLDTPRPKKYTFVERSYADSDDEDEEDTKVKSETKDGPPPESKLAPAVQELMKLIFNQQYFQNVMSALNYDVKKLPLGKLSKSTLTRGFQTLKDISILVADPSQAQTLYGTTFINATENLSNQYFSLIPHVFGRQRPPVIRDNAMLKQEVDLLESLSDMKDAAAILKSEIKDKEKENLHQLDRMYEGLGMEEMTPLVKTASEYQQLEAYLKESVGYTHHTNYKVDEIFRIERRGESKRFEEESPLAGPPQDRRLLWHGSRVTNFGGILSQGLRIAPPEAPVSGYMFGKGIYLADMSSKSANYCCSYNTNGNALLLVCEAELGNPMQELVNACYNAGDNAKAKGMHSTWGQGQTGPQQWKDAGCVHPSLAGVKMPDTSVPPGFTNVRNASLYYNEFIVYNVAQVRLRYLIRLRM